MKSTDIFLALELTSVWVVSVLHDSDDSGHVVSGVSEHDAESAVYADLYAHHDVLLLSSQHGCGPVATRHVLAHVYHGFLARQQSCGAGDATEVPLQLPPASHEFEAQPHTGVLASTDWRRVLLVHLVERITTPLEGLMQ